MNGKRNGAAIGLVLLCVSLASTALAGTPPQREATPQPVTTLPWVQGVSMADQKAAHASFQQGNGFLKESSFLQAAEKYREALARWNHPAIHYNLALALMNLDQPVEVYTHLEEAMRFGPDPLESERFEYAQSYKTLLDKQLVRLQLVCEQAGAVVALNGKTVIRAPGRYEVRLRAGAHSILATQEGYLVTDKSGTLLPGAQVKLQLKLYTVDDVTRYRRRWPAWLPWTVLGTGLAVAAGGGLLRLPTQERYDSFDTGVIRCGEGCKPTPSLTSLRTQGDSFQRASWGALAVGGGALATGAVLLLLNRAETYRINPETGATVNLLPLVGDTNGLLATFSF